MESLFINNITPFDVSYLNIGHDDAVVFFPFVMEYNMMLDNRA